MLIISSSLFLKIWFFFFQSFAVWLVCTFETGSYFFSLHFWIPVTLPFEDSKNLSVDVGGYSISSELKPSVLHIQSSDWQCLLTFFISSAISKYLEYPKCSNPLKNSVKMNFCGNAECKILLCTSSKAPIESSLYSFIENQIRWIQLSNRSKHGNVASLIWNWVQWWLLNNVANSIPNAMQQFGCIKQAWESVNTDKVINSLPALHYALQKPCFGKK